jgi:hypothetical protein
VILIGPERAPELNCITRTGRLSQPVRRPLRAVDFGALPEEDVAAAATPARAGA